MRETPIVSFEAIDKAGKTTLIQNLEDVVDNVRITTEPNENNKAGSLVREMLSENKTPPLAVFHTFLASHYIHVSEVIEPAIENEDIGVIFSDRYIDSRYAYQPLSLGKYLEDPLKWIKIVQETPEQAYIPDITIYIDITAEEALRRIDGESIERYEKKEFLRAVRENYKELVNESDRMFEVDGMQHSDPEKNKVAVLESTLEILRREGVLE